MNCDNCGKKLKRYEGHYLIQSKEKGWFKSFKTIGHLCMKCYATVDIEKFIESRENK